MKRKLTVSALIAALIAILAAGTYAYFNAETKVRNVITTGCVEIDLFETNADGSTEQTTKQDVMPGDVIERPAFVENPGDEPIFVRVRIDRGISGEDASAEELLHLNIDDHFWTYDDGFYYYYKILLPGETTEPIFTTVTVDGKNVDNTYLGKSLTLSLTADVVQSKNNGVDVWSAIGWPET